MNRTIVTFLLLSFFVSLCVGTIKLELDKEQSFSLEASVSGSFSLFFNTTDQALIKNYLLFDVDSTSEVAPSVSIYTNHKSQTFSSTGNYSFAIHKLNIIPGRSIFVNVDCDKNCTGVLRVRFAESKEIVVGRRFVDLLGKRSKIQQYKLKVSDKRWDEDSASVAVYLVPETGNNKLKGEIFAETKGHNESMATIENSGYTYRIYGESEDVLKENIESTSLFVKLRETARFTIVTAFRGRFTNIDNTAIGTEYLAKGKANCYSTARLSKEGSSIALQIASSEVKIYLNSGSLPQKLEDFEYQFPAHEMIWNTADENAGSIRIPLSKPGVESNKTVYFCIEGTGKALAYGIAMSQFVPHLMERRGQTQKMYVNGKEAEVVLHDQQMWRPLPLSAKFKVQSGCVNVLLKPRITYYYSFDLYTRLNEGADLFARPEEEDVILRNLTPEKGEVISTLSLPDKEGRCSGTELYSHCPTLIVIQNCDQSPQTRSVVTASLLREESLALLPSDSLRLTLPKGTREYLVIPDVSPAIDIVTVRIEMPKRAVRIRLGSVSVSRKGIVKDLEKGEKTVELNGKRNVTTVSFTRKLDGPLEGNYYITIEAEDDLNLQIEGQTYDVDGDDEDKGKTVHNIKQITQNSQLAMDVLNDTHNIGYYTFFLNNTGINGVLSKHDVVISASSMQGPSSTISLMMSTQPWPTKETAMWSGEVLRLAATDPKYQPNTYYYVVAEGSVVQQEKTEEEAQVQEPTKGAIVFLLLQGKKATEIEEGKKHKFADVMLLKLGISGNEDYVIHKKSGTAETVYISLAPALAFFDHYDYVMENKFDEDTMVDTLEDTVIIKGEELAKKNPACASAVRDPKKCEIQLTVVCHTTKCLYEIEAYKKSQEQVKTETKKKEAEDKKKTDL